MTESLSVFRRWATGYSGYSTTVVRVREFCLLRFFVTETQPEKQTDYTHTHIRVASRWKSKDWGKTICSPYTLRTGRSSAPRSWWQRRMTIPYGTWTPACLQLCASIVRIQVLYGDNMSKSNIRKITADPTKCNIDSSRRPSVFERLGTKPAIATTAAQNTSDYCRNWALNGSCSYGKNCKWVCPLRDPCVSSRRSPRPLGCTRWEISRLLCFLDLGREKTMCVRHVALHVYVLYSVEENWEQKDEEYKDINFHLL